MAKNFRDITDDLFTKLGAEDLADEIGCSVGSIKQARLDPDSSSYRTPPPNWEQAAQKLAQARAAYFAALAKKLSRN